MIKQLTSREVARILSISEYTVREYARRGIIPARKIGNMWRFTETDVMNWLKGPLYGNCSKVNGKQSDLVCDGAVESVQDKAWMGTSVDTEGFSPIEKRLEASKALDEIRARTVSMSKSEVADILGCTRRHSVSRGDYNE